MTRYRNDARLWAQLALVVQSDLGLDTENAERFARVLVCMVRRDQHRSTWSWGPGDPLPERPPRRVFDVDGATWDLQQSGHGCYRMAASDRARYANSDGDYEGVRPWPHLLDTEGPVTAVRLRGGG